MPMPRLLGGCLRLLIICSVMAGVFSGVKPVAAASATTIAHAELRGGPGYDFPVLATVLAGASLSIDGPPQNEFYPVTVAGQPGWIHGAVLNIAKDAVVTTSTAPVAPPGVGAEAPPASPVADAQTTPVSGWQTDVVSQEVPVGDQAASGTATAEPMPTAAPPTDAAMTAAPAATAVPVEGTTQTAPVAADQTAPATTPAPPPPALTGNASVPSGGNLFQSPDASSYILFWVPAGSTVWRLGEERNGFVHVDYMAMIGWISADLLADPVAVADEVVPPTAPVAENVRTPRPGSGVAFTAVELNLRAGPSANEAALTVVPAGARVIMTGVMENGFHRVDYKGTLGWVASDYLSTPPDPTPTAGTGGGADTRNRNRNGNRDTQNQGPAYKTYTRDEIVAIIYAAADRYGQDRADMLRVAECESALDPYAVHPSGSYGLFQFIRTTWKSTPYADHSMFDPVANSNAAAWMWAQGRRSEWVCK